MEEIRDNSTPKAAADAALTEEQKIKAKYSGEKVYKIAMTLHPDDETEVPVHYFFKRPGNPSYNRYVKTASKDMTGALKTFMFDAVIEESKAQLESDLEEYPALAISVGEKLLSMMGFTDLSNLKKL